MPRRSSASFIRPVSWPSSVIVPLVGSIIRLTMRRLVVFPQPEGPTSTVILPVGAVSVSSSTATVPSGYCLVTASNRIMRWPLTRSVTWLKPSGSPRSSPPARHPPARLSNLPGYWSAAGSAAWYGYGVYSRAVNAFSATRPGSWLVAHVAAKVDPSLFRWSGGRVAITGVPTLPMLVLTTTGRSSGLPRSVQLAYLAEPTGSWLVVASAMGQDRHP